MSAILFSPVDSEANLSRLYRDHFDELRRYLARKLKCSEAGRDAAQDIFLRLLVRPPQGPILNPRGFLLRSARNLVIDLSRSATARVTFVPIEGEQDGLHDPLADPVRIAEARQRLHALAQGIQDLPVKCRRVFFLHRFEGLMHDDIAAQLGISEKTVEKHLACAMLHLRRLWPDRAATV